jgi:aspartyl-tRNA(Asn)/glutamyl-tRNA(Gln) amidotransferase subunit B
MGELLHELKKRGHDPISSKNRDRVPVSDKCRITPQSLANLVKMIDEGAITGKIAKAVFEDMWASGKSPAEIVEEKGLKPISEVGAFVDDVIKNNPKQVQQYLKGKETMIGFFVGQVMKMTRGKADPKELNRLVKEKLDSLKNIY